MASLSSSLPTLRRFTPTRLIFVALLCSALILLPTYALLASNGGFDTSAAHNALWAPGGVQRGGASGAAAAMLGRAQAPEDRIAELMKHGAVIMPHLKNETAKAELGRASWKLLHTMAARFPEHPTEDERDTFKSFLYLFSRLYPCGECATHFQSLLAAYPPQTSNRGVASLYLCHLHNLVNERLGKEEFDCSANLKGIYDCGCGDEADEEEEGSEGARAAAPRRKAFEGRRKKLVGLSEREEGDDSPPPLPLNRDPVTGAELVGG